MSTSKRTTPRRCTRRRFVGSPECGRPAIVVDLESPAGACPRHGGNVIADYLATHPEYGKWAVVAP